MAELKEVLESSDEVERLIVLLECFRDESADDRLKKQRQEKRSDCSLGDCAPNDAIRFKASASQMSGVTDLAFSLGEQTRSLEFGSGVSSIDSSEVDT